MIKEEILNWTKKIKPLIKKDNKIYHLDNQCDHFLQSYHWMPIALNEANGLENIGEILTQHSYSYIGFFKPTVAEVIEQIPCYLLEKTNYFLVEKIISSENNIHYANTILFK